MSAKCAVATLLYTTDYLPGVFTLGHQLAKLLQDRKNIASCLVVSRDLWDSSLSALSKTLLRLLYNQVVQVDPLLDQELSVARNGENLKLLERPELAFTLIKARLWELTDFDRVLYLDADTLPLSEDFLDIFEMIPQQKSSQIYGAPDIGWPDMFNSGVLMLAPDKDLAVKLQRFIFDNTSIDGADQGILNQFFNPYCAAASGENTVYDWVRLPFIYNVTVPNYGYQNSPAVKYFQSQIKLVHFIGENKPWKGWLSGNGNGYATQWNRAYNDFLESFGLNEFFEEMGLQPPVAPEPEPAEETATPKANWDSFNRRVMQQSPKRYETHETGRPPNAQPTEPVLQPPEQTERIFPVANQDKHADLAAQFGDLALATVSNSAQPTDHMREQTQTIAISSEIPVCLPPAPVPTVERVFPEEQPQDPEPERVFPKERDLPPLSAPATAHTDQEASDEVKPMSEVHQALVTIREESEPTPAPRHIFDWEDTDYLQEVERTFPD